MASIEIGDGFHTEIACAANAVGSQSGKKFAVVGPLRLALSQMLKRLCNRSNVVDRIAIFPHQVDVDIFGSQRRFETLQFENRLVDLQVDAPKALVWNNQLDDDTVRNAGS